uniref:hypothetical protein n=1 Tax=Saccharothrix mutabilis TaxID=33921 RepID=UPI003CD0C111
MPIHIGAALLGHLNIQTTRGYVAVFDKRKVELGSCGRPYGTPCQHEHACIRCPMLHANPKMLARLDELETDLLARRTRAQAEGWGGEIEGIDMTLTFLRAKRDDTQRRLRRPAVNLGIPTSKEANERAAPPQPAATSHPRRKWTSTSCGTVCPRPPLLLAAVSVGTTTPGPGISGQGWSQRSNQARVRCRMSSWWLRSRIEWPSLG